MTSPSSFVTITRVVGGWFWAVWPSEEACHQALQAGTPPERYGRALAKFAARQAAELAAGGNVTYADAAWMARRAYTQLKKAGLVLDPEGVGQTPPAVAPVRQWFPQVAAQNASPYRAPEPVSRPPQLAAAARFLQLRQAFESCEPSPLADAPLATWLVPEDRQVPRVLSQRSLRQVLGLSFTMLANTRGVGPTRLDGLLAVLERAVGALRGEDPSRHSATASPVAGRQQYDRLVPNLLQLPINFREDGGTSSAYSQDAANDGDIDDEQWDVFCQRIRHHRLEFYPLGRFARSLRELPRGLWQEPLATFVDSPLAVVRNLPGYGQERLRDMLAVVGELGRLLAKTPTDGHLKVNVLPVALRDVASWIERTLAEQELPDADELHQHFVLPLLQQLEEDLGADVAEMIERRLGPDGRPQTLEQIATVYGVTRERIRQHTARGPEVFSVRWPEGRHLLDDFFEKFRDAPGSDSRAAMVQGCLDLLFGVSAVSGASAAAVLAAWEAAGRDKQTPMTGEELLAWLGRQFPMLPPEVGRKWVEQEARAFVRPAGPALYFSNSDIDVLLHQLFRRNRPTLLSDVCDLDENEERNLLGRVGRDMRFVQDEYHRLQPSENCSFVRLNGTWRIRLACIAAPSDPDRETISLETLVNLIITGLLQAGVADATVWGVHRYANEMLERIHLARLPETVTPFILGDVLVRQSNGLIRPMRRRRLRWDRAGTAIPVRGKRGWIGHVVAAGGMPVTVSELGDLLRRYYQDYAPYVLEQVDLDADEEGTYHCSATLLRGIPHRVPALLVPADWQFDAERENVSEEVKLVVARVQELAREGSLRRTDLAYAPWLADLAQRRGYGADIWQARPDAAHDHRAQLTVGAPIGEVTDETGEVPRRSPASGRNVDEMPSKFL